MTASGADFEQFMRRRKQAASAYVSGDASPLEAMVARTSEASFFGPYGGVTTGADDVAASYAKGAESFAPGSKSELEVLHAGGDSDIGYWTGVQHATVNLKGRDQPVPMALRITEVFRREDGHWKLVHRHADTLTEAPKAGS